MLLLCNRRLATRDAMLQSDAMFTSIRFSKLLCKPTSRPEMNENILYRHVIHVYTFYIPVVVVIVVIKKYPDVKIMQ